MLEVKVDLSFTEEQNIIKETARNFAREVLDPTAAARDRDSLFPTEELKQMAELGLMSVNVPSQYGGSEAGVVAYALAGIEISRGCASTAVAMAVTNMVAEIICQFGSEAHKEKYVTQLCSGKTLGAFLLTEPASGSDAAALRTRAEKRGDAYLLNGEKVFITNGAYAGVNIVWARTKAEIKGSKGISCFIVEGGTPGLIVAREEEKMGLRGSNTVGIRFEDCLVPAENMLNKPEGGFPLAMVALDGGRIGVASQALGIGMAAMDLMKEYASTREQFGKPLASFEAIQWMIADSAVELASAKWLTLHAAYLKEKGQRYTMEASMAKVSASEVANIICGRAIQVMGGYGFIKEYPAERLYRDARVTTIYEGTSEIQRIVIAREVLDKVKKS